MKGEIMLATVTIEEAQAHLTELIKKLEPGEELVILEAGKPVATLSRRERTSWPCQPGTAKDTKHWMAPDFDAPLEVFKEYMQ
jgi:antitoxin (DNA-binding transcriptional repressor) of toxin-antitoxin stability system